MIATETGRALKQRLSGFGLDLNMPVVWPNRNTATPSTRHFAAEIVRAANQRLTVSGQHRYSGSLVVTVATESGKGSGEADGIADAVAAHFPADLVLVLDSGRLRVTAAPTVRDGFADGGFWRTPVVVPFEVTA